jgi:hypothetical protein
MTASRPQSKQQPPAEPRTVPTASNPPMPTTHQRRTTATETQELFQPSATSDRASDRTGRKPLSAVHRSFTSAFALVLFALAIMDKLGGGVQAAFAPADSAALKTAVGSCDWSSSASAYVCTGGCLGETTDGSCPTFAASDDGTGNPYGVMGEWNVSQVKSFDNSTSNFHFFVFLINCLFHELVIL